MSSRPLLEAHIVEGDSPEVLKLRREVRRLEGELDDALADAKCARTDSAQAVRALQKLRQQLGPLYNALRDVFGELEILGDEQESQVEQGSNNPRINAVWESWKQKLGGSVAKAIDALLTHRELNTQQLAIATGLHRTTIPKIVYEMNKAGLINKNGGRFSLKQL